MSILESMFRRDVDCILMYCLSSKQVTEKVCSIFGWAMDQKPMAVLSLLIGAHRQCCPSFHASLKWCSYLLSSLPVGASHIPRVWQPSVTLTQVIGAGLVHQAP